MKTKANNDIRELIKSVGLTQWEVGEGLNLGESTFSRKLRKELTNEQKEELIKKIVEMVKGYES
ncbi:MAG: hypothetical protein K0S51_2283 [Bacillales bacterium]|jgi:uncharacterized tellurite resistance protein B-like protein|nr:hypothetical protein [Bacillales bacterium]